MMSLCLLVTMVIFLGQVNGLSEYCSAINRKELYDKLESCYRMKSTDPTSTTTLSPTRSPTTTPRSLTTGLPTALSPNSLLTRPNQVFLGHF